MTKVAVKRVKLHDAVQFKGSEAPDSMYEEGRNAERVMYDRGTNNIHIFWRGTEHVFKSWDYYTPFPESLEPKSYMGFVDTMTTAQVPEAKGQSKKNKEKKKS